MMKNNNNHTIDTQRVYCTSAIVKTVGRAVAISLDDATLPGAARNKHMTVLFRKRQRWNNDEIESISRETDRWIREKYGNNKAPVTFNIEAHGPQSVKIAGDLHDLCLHLRLNFAALSPDEQRPPHVKLFVNGARGKKHHKAPKAPKTCHVCGDSDHKKRNCPKNDKKRNCPKNDKKQNGKMRKKQNMKQKVQRMISKIDELTAQKQAEIELLRDEKQSLSQLLSKEEDIKNDIKNIAKSFKHKRKQLRMKNKRKPRKIKANKLAKINKKQRKDQQQKRKAQRRLEREERKRLRQERLKKLDTARVVSLPLNNKDIGGFSTLNIHIDGYNIIGCDALCRKSMRGKGRGRKEARGRLVNLVQQQFPYAVKALNLSYDVALSVWFDGNGSNMNTKDVSVLYSTRKQSVDDRLVQMFSGKNNANVLVITSDKELTLRLHDIGCKVMKSGVFYKTFLKEEKKDNAVDIVVDEEELKEDIESDEDFVKVITSKMESGETGGADEEDTDSSDQMEGGDHVFNVTDDHDNDVDKFIDDDDDDEDDEEFTTIYGEDSEDIEMDVE